MYFFSLAETTRCGEGLRSSRSASKRRGPEQRGRSGHGRVGRQGVGTSDVRSEFFFGRIGLFFANESFEKLFFCAHPSWPRCLPDRLRSGASRATQVACKAKRWFSQSQDERYKKGAKQNDS